MKFKKEDLLAIKTLDDKRETVVVVSVHHKGNFAYCYGIETGQYRLIYEKDVDFLITEGFKTKFPLNELFDLDSYLYEVTVGSFSYTPFYGFKFPYEDEDDETDSDP